MTRFSAPVAFALGVVAAATLPLGGAQAAQVITFGQTSANNTVTATDNGAATQTTISISQANVDITQILGGSPVTGFMDLSAVSVDAATTVGGAVIQHYNGTFDITSGAGGTGTNFLSGSFTDAAFGALTGDQLSVNVANPPDTLTLTSSVIPASELKAPNAFSVTFTNVTPALAENGTTIAPFTAAFSGDASASAVAVPEPASLAPFGAALLSLLSIQWLRRRRQ